FMVAIPLFLPIWNGETIAPTDFTFASIPIRWLLILIGGVLVPSLATKWVFTKVSNAKFCEKSGVFLKKHRVLNLEFDFAENALELLKRQEYEAVAKLPKADGRYPSHSAHVILWQHDCAQVAFLEMQAKFKGEYTSFGKVRVAKKKWLAFSVLVDRDRTQLINQSFLMTP
ncbi:hypothetical protein IQ250_30215, partial [Pseudanabaenaceae cyanobacterium LEGE 13415]|nr:hypothetical protein [Pseudanabaenaceae cyanobacterium LEGE 13415]